MVVISGKATLNELDTVYNLRGLYDLVEIVTVQNHNERAIARAREEEIKKSRQF